MSERATRYFVLMGERAWETESVEQAEEEIYFQFQDANWGVVESVDEVVPLLETEDTATVKVYRHKGDVAYVLAV